MIKFLLLVSLFSEFERFTEKLIVLIIIILRGKKEEEISTASRYSIIYIYLGTQGYLVRINKLIS